VLGADHPEHGAFLGMHQTLGLTVLLLVVLRVLWLGQRPAQRQLALVTHRGLCALMLNFPVTGILLTAWPGDAMDIYAWSVAGFLTPDAHLGAVTKHHFTDRRPQDIRRMLR
jgi:cytochrome b561